MTAGFLLISYFVKGLVNELLAISEPKNMYQALLYSYAYGKITYEQGSVRFSHKTVRVVARLSNKPRLSCRDFNRLVGLGLIYAARTALTQEQLVGSYQHWHRLTLILQ